MSGLGLSLKGVGKGDLSCEYEKDSESGSQAADYSDTEFHPEAASVCAERRRRTCLLFCQNIPSSG